MPSDGAEARVAAALRAFAARGRAVHVMVGNRDFLVGRRFLESAHAHGLADPTVVAAFGARLLVSHGDLLCTRDVAYQRFRRVVRHRAVRSAFSGLPRHLRERLGRATRARSHGGQHHAQSDPRLDVDDGAALAWLDALDVPRLLHGHTHRPATHALAGGRQRIVLSDWEFDQGPVRGDVLRWTAAGFERRAVAAA